MLYRVCKRVFDMTAALLGLIGTSPLWIVAAAGILISDPGPVFYMANRVGKDNKPFRMFKFRSMRVDKGADEKSFMAEESRIFAFGNFIRRFKIDELPQLLNIIMGDMSVVGPRPAAKDQTEIVRAGKFSCAADVKPGLTGPGALYDYIYGDTADSEEEYQATVLPTRLELEVYYIKNKSALYDFRMILYTVECIFCTVFRREPERIIAELKSCAETERVSVPVR